VKGGTRRATLTIYHAQRAGPTPPPSLPPPLAVATYLYILLTCLRHWLDGRAPNMGTTATPSLIRRPSVLCAHAVQTGPRMHARLLARVRYASVAWIERTVLTRHDLPALPLRTARYTIMPLSVVSLPGFYAAKRRTCLTDLHAPGYTRYCATLSRTERRTLRQARRPRQQSAVLRCSPRSYSMVGPSDVGCSSPLCSPSYGLTAPPLTSLRCYHIRCHGTTRAAHLPPHHT